jgi:hypothetical protein
MAGRHSGTLGVAARNFSTGEEVLLRADDVLPTASVIKLPILVELLRQAEDGRLQLAERIDLRDVDKCGGSGILKVFQAGLQPTRDVATLMVVLSDNTATNLAIDAVGGVELVNRAMAELGLPTIKLHNRIDFQLIGSDVRQLGESSPRDMLALVQGIADRTVFGVEVSEEAERMLAGQQYLTKCRVTCSIAVRCGTWFVGRHNCREQDWFLHRHPRRRGHCPIPEGGGFAYAVFSHESKDETFLAEAEGSVLAGLVGRPWSNTGGPAAGWRPPWQPLTPLPDAGPRAPQEQHSHDQATHVLNAELLDGRDSARLADVRVLVEGLTEVVEEPGAASS